MTIMDIIKKCECGCDCAPNEGKRFISGHNSRGKRKKYNKFICKNCAKEFEAMPHIKKRAYCSVECRDDFRRKMTGQNHPMYNREVVSCQECGKEIEKTPSRLQKTTMTFCSKECRIEGHKKALTGKVHTKQKRTGKNSARLRDGNKCVLCGFGHVTTVHHIIAKRLGGGNEIQNLVTLCPNHHYMVHAGLIPEQDLKKHAKIFSFYNGEEKTISNLKKNKPNFRGEAICES